MLRLQWWFLSLKREYTETTTEVEAPEDSRRIDVESSDVGIDTQDYAVTDDTDSNLFSDEPPERIEVVLGERQDTGDDLIWKGSVEGSPHFFILGSTGAGKSTTVRRLLSEVTQHGLPSLIIDFHGDFAKRETPFMQRFNPTVIDAAKGLPFSPLERLSPGTASEHDILTNSLDIAEIIAYVCELGDIQRDLVYEAIRDVSTAAEIESSQKTPALSAVFERLRCLEEERRRGVRNTVARCRSLFEFGLFDESKPPIRFQDLIRKPTVITLNSLGRETLQLAAGAFILRRLYKEMFLWGESDRLRLMVVIDEAHRLAKDASLPKLMKEGRKFGVTIVVASQGVRDFHAAVLENAGTKLIFRTNYPDSKKVAQFLRAPKSRKHLLGDLAERLENLQVGEAFTQTPEMKYCSLTRMFVG